MGPIWYLALVPFLGGLGLSAVGALDLFADRLLRRTGRRTTGVVIGHAGTQRGLRASPHPVVRWISAEGIPCERVLTDSYGGQVLAEGTPVRLIVDRADPATAHLDTEERAAVGVVLLAAGTLLWLGTLVAVLTKLAALTAYAGR